MYELFIYPMKIIIGVYGVCKSQDTEGLFDFITCVGTFLCEDACGWLLAMTCMDV